MSSDPVSDILRFTSAQTIVSGGFTAGGEWSIRFPAPDKTKFFALVKGSCRLLIDGDAAPTVIETGDIILLTGVPSFVMASDIALAPVDAHSGFSGEGLRFGAFGAGEDCIQIGGHIRLDPISGALLSDVLPPLIHVRAGAPQAQVLQWLLEQLVRERAADLPGASLAASQLAQLIFVQILRAHLATAAPLAAGWLRAVRDERIAPALRLMHAEPGRAWQLEELARAASMSRTSFALHFKTVAGVAPLTYLTEWRMRLAERALREDDVPVGELAQSLGYTSESAFSNAFKRVNGNAPRRYRMLARSA